MIKYTLLNAFILFSTINYSQISTISVVNDLEKVRQYDSTKSFDSREDLKIYIGQDIYFPESKYSFRIIDIFDTIIYKDLSHGNQVDYYKSGICFRLIEQSTERRTFYRLVETKGDLRHYNATFFIVGNLYKRNHIYINQNLVAQNELSDIKELSTNNLINIPKGSIWRFKEINIVKIEDNNPYGYSPIIKLINDDGLMIWFIGNELEYFFGDEKFRIAKKDDFKTDFQLQEIETSKIAKELYEKKQENEQKLRDKEGIRSYTKLYGSRYAKNIWEGTVILGMTKKMCEEAWGTDFTLVTEKVKGGTIDKWIFSFSKILIFKNDILIKAIY
jgi:hypothetical protein